MSDQVLTSTVELLSIKIRPIIMKPDCRAVPTIVPIQACILDRREFNIPFLIIRAREGPGIIAANK